MRISLLEQLYLQLALRQESLRRGLFVFFEIFLIYHRLSQIILITFLKTPAAFDGQVAENAQRRHWLLPGFLDARRCQFSRCAGEIPQRSLLAVSSVRNAVCKLQKLLVLSFASNCNADCSPFFSHLPHAVAVDKDLCVHVCVCVMEMNESYSRHNFDGSSESESLVYDCKLWQ